VIHETERILSIEKNRDLTFRRASGLHSGESKEGGND
jgi:hypothetical protein